MHTLTTEDLEREPRRLLDDAQRGEASLVTRAGEPIMLAVPLDANEGSRQIRLEVAVRLFDQDQISLGIAARIAGVSYSAMIDELGRRQIAVVRYAPEELDRELELLRGTSGR